MRLLTRQNGDVWMHMVRIGAIVNRNELPHDALQTRSGLRWIRNAVPCAAPGARAPPISNAFRPLR